MSDKHILSKEYLRLNMERHHEHSKEIIKLGWGMLGVNIPLLLLMLLLLQFWNPSKLWMAAVSGGSVILFGGAAFFGLFFLISGLIGRMLNPFERMLRTGKFVIIKCRAVRLLEYEYASGEDYDTDYFTEYAYHNDTCTFTGRKNLDLLWTDFASKAFFVVLEKRGREYCPRTCFPICPDVVTELGDDLKPYYVDKPLRIRMKCPRYAEGNPSVRLVESYSEEE